MALPRFSKTYPTAMKTTSQLYYLHALTPLHVGSGRGEGYIDLPLTREQATDLPVVPGSAVKGVLRYEHEPDWPTTVANSLFGKAPVPGSEGEEASGLLRVGDARLLCLPVRSWRGVFAWATCPLVLRRYWRDSADVKDIDDSQRVSLIPDLDGNDEAWVIANSELVWSGDKIYLEDLNLRAVQGQQKAEDWAKHIAERVFPKPEDEDWRTEFKKRFAILPDTLFAFLAKHATELRAHVRLSDKRTVENGPWYEESLPAESLLWGLMGRDVFRGKSQATDTDQLWEVIREERRLQIGGSATVGLGQVRWVCGREGG
jgi:CRISPR-associated protein Cmr4